MTLAVALVLTATAAWACSCTNWRTAEAQLENTDVMFIGRAVSTTPTPDALRRQGRLNDLSAMETTRFEVRRTLKGAHVPSQIIAHAPEGAGAVCGVGFRTGRDYVVLANRYHGHLITGSCQRPLFPLSDYDRVVRRQAR